MHLFPETIAKAPILALVMGLLLLYVWTARSRPTKPDNEKHRLQKLVLVQGQERIRTTQAIEQVIIGILLIADEHVAQGRKRSVEQLVRQILIFWKMGIGWSSGAQNALSWELAQCIIHIGELKSEDQSEWVQAVFRTANAPRPGQFGDKLRWN
jgi:hypothetical protein